MSGNLRISGSEDYKDALKTMAGINPGAIAAMLEMSAEAKDAGKDPLSPLKSLDQAGLYGSDIWMFYKDVCQNKAGRGLEILADFESGQLPRERLHHAVRNRGDGLVEMAPSVGLRKPQFGGGGYGGGGREGSAGLSP
jgi:hypothetical protein